MNVEVCRDEDGGEKDLADLKGMDDYLLHYGKFLGRKAIDSLSPMHVPGNDGLPDFSGLLREPFEAQKHCVAGIVKMFTDRKNGFLSGEMGVGKTLIGMAAVHEHAKRSRREGGSGGRYRAIVLCPDHLIAKWQREIEETIPEVIVTRFGPTEIDLLLKGRRNGNGKQETGTRRTLRDILALTEKGRNGRWSRPDGAEWYIIGRDQAKWMPTWDGLADSTGRCSARHVKISDGETAVVYRCPSCGSIVHTQKGEIASSKYLSSKGSSQKRCLEWIMETAFDPEHPDARPDRMAVPDRYRRQCYDGRCDVYGGRTWIMRRCNEPLYQYTNKPYRWAASMIIQKKLRRFFDYLIIDEVHEQKSDVSARSMAAGKMMAASRHTLAMTGTMIGGYADHLYPIMMRMTPDSLRHEGFEWGKSLKFSEVYGKIDRIITTSESPGTSIGGRSQSMRRAKTGESKEVKYVRPGIMPSLFGNHLIGSSVFIMLDEMAENLPYFYEYVGGRCSEDADESEKAGWYDTAIEMNPDQSIEYRRIERILSSENKELLKHGSMKLLGAMLFTLLDYPDHPYGWTHPDEVVEAFDGVGDVDKTHTVGYWNLPNIRTVQNWVGVVTPRTLPDIVYPKEKALIDICKKQRADGRQTWVYLQMTGKRDVQKRLCKLLEAEGLRVGILKATDVAPMEREEWIRCHGKCYDVMLSNPRLVSTGLDLFSKERGGHNYSTLVFYQTGYDSFTMKQASRRAWRLMQPLDCRVYYLYYRETMQHRAINLMAKKLAAMAALEGEFSEDGLAAMAGDDGMQMALARSLSESIDTDDVRRSWTKITSGPKKGTSALVELGRTIPPSPLDSLSIGDQLVAETILDQPMIYKFPTPEEQYDIPELTPEIMAKIFANMRAAGMEV